MPSTVVKLAEAAGEDVQVVVGTVPVARGEVVVDDERATVRVTEVLPVGWRGRRVMSPLSLRWRRTRRPGLNREASASPGACWRSRPWSWRSRLHLGRPPWDLRARFGNAPPGAPPLRAPFRWASGVPSWSSLSTVAGCSWVCLRSGRPSDRTGGDAAELRRRTRAIGQDRTGRALVIRRLSPVILATGLVLVALVAAPAARRRRRVSTSTSRASGRCRPAPDRSAPDAADVRPAILVTMTSFTRIVIVFHFLRQALGTQEMPPNQVLVGLALFLTMFIMAPVGARVNEQALQRRSPARSRLTRPSSGLLRRSASTC